MGVPLFWHQADNFGDALAPWLVRHLSGQDVEYIPLDKTDGPIPHLVTGSIFKHSLKRGIVWGAGCAYEEELDPSQIAPPSDTLQIIATRGTLSKKRVEAAGHSPVTAGDPGLLLPRFYTPQEGSRCSVGIICSWVDYLDVHVAYGSSVPVLNASSPIEEVIDTIASWDVVVASCLHGLVAAVAYDKPVVWAEFSDLMLGDGFKFRDFLSLFDVDDPKPVVRPGVSGLTDEAQRFEVTQSDALLACCPFRKTDLVSG